jgi:hypothetical protein
MRRKETTLLGNPEMDEEIPMMNCSLNIPNAHSERSCGNVTSFLCYSSNIETRSNYEPTDNQGAYECNFCPLAGIIASFPLYLRTIGDDCMRPRNPFAVELDTCKLEQIQETGSGRTEAMTSPSFIRGAIF